jgi:murein DD-endopeptidase MepM/ murein hydrolase activator NlpD
MLKPAFPTISTAMVTQTFGNYNPALYGGDRKHKGIDYGVVSGTPVFACMDGVVAMATNQQTGYGRHVRLIHDDGCMSIYGHLSALMVKPGEYVKAGQQIGKSGGDPKDGIDGDGLSTGPHLHWEIRPAGLHASDQSAVDPMLHCLKYVPGVFQTAEVSADMGLNVRDMPSAVGRYLSTLFRKQIVKVIETKDGWARLNSLRDEWVSAKYLFFTGAVTHVLESPEIAPVEMPLADKVARLWAAHPELH